MKITLSNHGGVPIYEQIKEQIRAQIYAGELREGESLPSIRQLARDLKISVITTTRAYNDLEQEGLVTGMQGRGYYVLPQNRQRMRESALREIEENLLAAITAARLCDIQRAQLIEMLEVISKEEGYA